jgi:hypothetical protein|nr:MAG TPA: hypothetical protein [Caudoviricetes sp.]
MTETVEKQEVEKQEKRSKKTAEPTQTEVLTVLTGDNVAPEILLQAGGGKYPFTLYAQNITQSTIALPELQTDVQAYAKNVRLTFKNENALGVFCVNYAHFASLWGWDENNGLILRTKEIE